MNQPGNRRGPVFHVLSFYAASLVLGYALFEGIPLVYMSFGIGLAASVTMTVATINIHHFIVDAVIWRLKKSDNNRGVVDSASMG